MTTLIISNEEKDDMKIIKYLEESGLLIKGVRKTIKNKTNGQKQRFFGKLLGTLVASLLGNILASKGTIKVSKDTIRAGERTMRAGRDFKCRLIL